MKTHIKTLIFIFFIALASSYEVQAQKFAFKTDLLKLSHTAVNLGIEAPAGNRFTIELEGAYKPWNLSDSGRRGKYALVQPEFRYWFCNIFDGSFLGVHLHGGIYNLGGVKSITALSEHRYEGWFVGAGFAYGYNFILSPHLNLELEAGAGYAYSRYDKYRCVDCGAKVEEKVPYHYFGFTKASVSLIYLIY